MQRSNCFAFIAMLASCRALVLVIPALATPVLVTPALATPVLVTPVLFTPALADDAPPAPASLVQRVAPEAAEAILGREVDDGEGKDIGRLIDVLVDEYGQPQAAVIDFGGFLGVGNRKIAVHWGTLRFKPATGKHVITLDMTPDQIKAAPEYNDVDKAAPVVTPANAVPNAH